ncbi:MAG: DUF456 domain-containing protein [Bacteroidales bacterium]|nr:DUF456 domain-containing protein [Bacteroidales bacterium]
MDLLLIVIGLIFIILGIAGCILPVIPGPPLAYIGLLFMHWTKFTSFSSNFLILWALIAIAVTVLDYIVPVWGTKKFGGTKYGTWGSMVGLLFGLFLGPIGIIAGPFVGALIGELIGGRNSNDALKAAAGSFIGFLLGSGIKLIASGMMAYYFSKETFYFINQLLS